MSANEAPPSRCFACNQESGAPVYFEDTAWLCPACDEIFQWGRKTLGACIEVPPEKITPRSRFEEDLAIGSLDLGHYLLDVEERYGVYISCEWGLPGNRMVDVIAYIRANHSEPPP